MRPVDYSKNETAKLYQAGLSREAAEAKGANMVEFDQLEEKYKGGSIPAHEMGGFAKTEPFSSDYHTGGAQGALLRKISKDLKEEKAKEDMLATPDSSPAP
jgi:hypothetical protein